MHKHDVKRGVVVLLVFLILINLSYFTQAFGLSTPYLENDTLRVSPGSIHTYAVTIQNGDIEDYYVDINYSSKENVVSLGKTEYFVLSNTYDNTFYFNINIPIESQTGKTYILEYSAKPRLSNVSIMQPIKEINRTINILVIADTNANMIPEVPKEEKIKEVQPETQSTNDNTPKKNHIGTYLIIIIILTLVILIANRLWRLSKGLSSKLSNEKVTTYTISEAINLKEVENLLEKMSDEEFRLPVIKSLFKEKISELTTHNLTKDIKSMSRKELIHIIEKIR
jgi:hypothetical protein